MIGKLRTRLGALAISVTALASSGCICGGYDPYYSYEEAYPSYYQQPCPQIIYQQPQVQYFQQPQPQILAKQTYSGINSPPVVEKKSEPAAMPPKPVPEEIPAPEHINPSNLKPIKPINKTA